MWRLVNRARWISNLLTSAGRAGRCVLSVDPGASLVGRRLWMGIWRSKFMVWFGWVNRPVCVCVCVCSGVRGRGSSGRKGRNFLFRDLDGGGEPGQ